MPSALEQASFAAQRLASVPASSRRRAAFASSVGVKDAVAEAVAMACQHRGDASDIRKVGADASDHAGACRVFGCAYDDEARAASMQRRISRIARSRPIKTDLAIRKWPIFSSFTCGMAAMGRRCQRSGHGRHGPQAQGWRHGPRPLQGGQFGIAFGKAALGVEVARRRYAARPPPRRCGPQPRSGRASWPMNMETRQPASRRGR